jgi:hypothetical protein
MMLSFFLFLNELGACEPWLHNPTSGFYNSPASCNKFIVFDFVLKDFFLKISLKLDQNFHISYQIL